MSLILKQKHRRYTIISVICIIPSLITALALIVESIIGNPVARSLLEFVVARHSATLQIVWLLLPLWGYYLAQQAYQRGTIDRWRSLNKFTLRAALILLIACVGGGLALTFLV